MLSEKTMGANRRMIFTPSTIYRDNYKARPMVSNAENLAHRPLPKTITHRPFIRKYYETHRPLAGPLAFDMFLKPKEIIRTVPSQAQKRYEKIVDDQLEEVQRTRPRVIMTPQVSVDDILDPQARRVIVEETYKSSTTHASKEVAFNQLRVTAPLGEHPALACPIFLEKYQPHAVDMEWRMDSVQWDARQLRTYVDTDKVFWKNKDVYKLMESMLFDYETTGRTDFRHGQIIPYPKTEYKEKPNCVFIRPPPLKGIQTLTPWNVRLRFDTFLKPKDIIGTNPREVQKTYKKPIDVEREQTQKTRPRLVMTPAVSMDDIEDPRMRQILVEDMYTSDMTQKLREVVAPYLSVRAPFPGMPAPANPIYLPPLREPTVSPEWRKDSVKWDAAQLRAHCDPTKQFWLNKEQSKCRACDETAMLTKKRRMLGQVKIGKNY